VGSPEYNDTLAKKRLAYVTNFLGITNATNVQLKPYGLVRKYDVKDYKSWRRVDVYYSTHPLLVKADTSGNVQPTVKTEEENQAEQPVQEPVTQNEENLHGNDENDTNDLDNYANGDLAYILNVEFIEGTAKMDLKSQSEVKKFAQYLKDHPNLSILIRGHVCCGNNMRISKARAKAVYHELIKQGVEKDRLDYVGMSNTEPLVFPEKTNADRQRNRRVDVKFKVIDL
jgi:outer membrane protein OmpA-like peptidoglycan-associated protein